MPITQAAFERLAVLLQTRSGLQLGPDKRYLVEARLGPLLAGAGLATLDMLADRCCSQPDGPLARAVMEAMTTNETLFFRDQQPFADLAQRVLPRLGAVRNPGTALRVWSAAASFGQEAYSIAIVAAEQRAALGGRAVEIVATDLSQAAIERARAGLFSDFEVQRGLSPARLQTHFERVGQQWRAGPALRTSIRFQIHNLLADTDALGLFDVVFCRNVLIYFGRETKRRVLASLGRHLAPDGVLYLGGTETLLGLDCEFVQQPGVASGYVRANALARRNLALTG